MSYTPDLSAARFRAKRTNLIDKELLEKFKLKYPQYKNLDLATFRKVFHHHCGEIRETVISTRDGVELPEGIGCLFIGAIRYKGPRLVNWAKCKQMGQRVYEKNFTSDGMLAKIYYSNYGTKYSMRDKQLWRFTPCRNFKRDTSKVFSERWTMFMESPNYSKLTKDYNRTIARQIMAKRAERQIKDYNDFDI